MPHLPDPEGLYHAQNYIFALLITSVLRTASITPFCEQLCMKVIDSEPEFHEMFKEAKQSCDSLQLQQWLQSNIVT